ncbi:GNAT family N-acetyltransferase [Phenylobacterium sp.]|uniref:GNAT family N-acetyltransferase n=1 Tax=Phenylobacterium sp. TaxID=1871053 RepID=UPI0035AF0403
MIRHARPADRPAIGEVTAAAFGRTDEADLVERLRKAGDVMFELVAEEDGQIVGHILFSRLWADRIELLYAALAPVSVRPDRQRQGLGGELIRAGLDACRDFGASGVLLLGHPDYYPRFGFSAEAAAQVASPYAGSPAFMALALEDGAFEGPLTVAYPDAFTA